MSINVGQNDNLPVEVQGIEIKGSTALVAFVFNAVANRPDSEECVGAKETLVAQRTGHPDYNEIVSLAATAMKKDLAKAIAYLDELASDSN